MSFCLYSIKVRNVACVKGDKGYTNLLPCVWVLIKPLLHVFREKRKVVLERSSKFSAFKKTVTKLNDSQTIKKLNSN